MANNCNKLRVVVLAGCKVLTSKSMIALSQNCPNLESVNVNGTAVGDDGVQALVRKCGGLGSLVLNGCKCITDDAIVVCEGLF